MQFDLYVEGTPQGKDRPRFVRATGRTYTPKETLLAEERIRKAWRERGEPVVSGAVRVAVFALVTRPASHYLKNGIDFSAEGKRHPHPDNRKPDLDNVLKLVLDALNKHAFKDDVQVTQLAANRRWTATQEGLTIVVSEVE